jgi:membrane protein
MLFRIAPATVVGFLDDDGPGVAAELAYRFFLALIPFFIFLASLSGFLAAVGDVPDAAKRLTALVSSTLPSNIGSLLTEELERILGERRTGYLSVSVLLTLFAATGATNALIKTMNRAHDVRESRSLIRKYLLSVGLTLLAAGAVLASLIVLVAVRIFAGTIAMSLGLGGQYAELIGLLPLPIVLVGLLVGASVLYRLGPNVHVPAAAVLPGAVFFALVGVSSTYGFSLYVGTLGTYELTYGALASVVVMLIWLYVSAAILLLGAELSGAIAKEITFPLSSQRARLQRRRASPGCECS